jgi:hypothetical protein
MLKKQEISGRSIRFLAGGTETGRESVYGDSPDRGILPVFRLPSGILNTYKMTGTPRQLSCIICIGDRAGMKLNADIIHHELKKNYTVEMYGTGTNRLVLSLPEFYMENEVEFLTEHLYLATADHLPKRPRIGKDAVLVCIGEHINLKNYRNRICLIIIKNKADFFKVYQYLQGIFDFYDEWERQLYQDLFNDEEVQRLVSDSAAVFPHPLFVLDKGFHYIAASDDDASNEDWQPGENGALHTDAVDKFLSAYELMTEKKGAIRFDLLNKKVLCVNLFNKNGNYEGCLCIDQDNGSFEGEGALAEYLGSMLELAIAKNPAVINDEQSSLRQVMRTLVEEMPLSYTQRWVLNAANRKNTYVCVLMEYQTTHSPLPVSYICDSFEELFEDSFAFPLDQMMTGFVDIGSLGDKKKDYRAGLNRKLKDFIARMRLNAGISNEFNDLFDIRIHYLQARSALENGKMMSPAGNLFYFASYALTEMIINSLGGLPSEAYYPSGLKNVLEHDRTSGVSYLETLKVFLEENMSYTAAAQKLFIHRSTLIDRIARIERELHVNLQDSDQRLQLEILLKAIDIEQMVRMQ